MTLTVRAMRGIHAWLHYCLSIGWPRSSLKGLTDLWWKYHDEQGNLIGSANDGGADGG